MASDFTTTPEQYRIPPPNYTQIPNVIFDYWMAVLSPTEFKVLLCICRKTFGWQKLMDSISSKQIEKMTGVSKNTITSAIEKLISLSLVTKIKSKTSDGDDAPNTFLINVFDETQNLGGGRSNFDPGVGQILTPGVGQILTPQKKDLTKERNTKEKETPTPKICKTEKIAFRENVMLFQSEYDRLFDEVGQEQLEWMLDKLSSNKLSKGTVYKCDAATMNKGGWVREAYQEKCNKPQTSKTTTLSLPENEEIAKKMHKEWTSPHYRLDICNDHVEIIPKSGQQLPDFLKFIENGFAMQLESILRKRGFIRRS